MLTQVIAIAALLVGSAPLDAAVSVPMAVSARYPESAAQAVAPAGGGGEFDRRLAGRWQSTPEEFRLTTDFDISVWGPNASSVRTVTLTISPSGQGTLEVVKKVVDARRRTVRASESIEKAQIVVGAPVAATAGRVEHPVKVTSAERTYPDDPGYRWPLDGLGVKIATIEGGAPGTIEVRFDTPEGRGSFWETLRKVRTGAAPARTTRSGAASAPRTP
jgi:hypothetical protein